MHVKQEVRRQDDTRLTTDGGTVGWMRSWTENLIFSSVIQSSEVLLLPLMLYETVMVGSE